MDTGVSDNEIHIRIDEESVLAHFANRHARTIQRPVAAIGQEVQDATLFVENELIVDGEDRALVEEIASRYRAEIVPEAPIPPTPEMLERERHLDLSEMPQTVVLRFEAPPVIEDWEPLLERALGESGGLRGEIIVTSEMGAAVAALATRFALDGRPVGLNLLGHPLRMPLSTAQEGPIPVAGANPFAWQAFSGRTRMVETWQLVDSIRQMRGDSFIILGIMDRGFWVDNAGVPLIGGGQAVSDFGAGVMQLNLSNEGQSVGGMSPDGNAWHGNAVASAAAAVVNNAAGAAGSGGTVATPMFFLTDISVKQLMYCAKICAAWGIDVLNMSIGTWGQTELWFPTSLWNKTFQFASFNNVVMIAAAGNDTLDLPDDRNIRPATRTPGVLTVGALDTNDNAAGFSNFGSSVGLWAPGVSIPVAPDGNNPNGSRVNGTSFAAPIVAGVAAMMRFANSTLSAEAIRRILVETGWSGSGRVTKGLDAFAAVMAAIQQMLPDYDEPNNTPASARDLIPTGPGGALAPGFSGFAARSSNIDPDYWKFRVEKLSSVVVSVDWYERLGTLYVAVEAENPDVRGPDEMTRVGTAQSGSVTLSGLLPPGTYRVRIGGTGVTAYRLLVQRQPAQLMADIFEPNDSFEHAARLRFESSKWSFMLARSWGPGTYDATLHQDRLISPVLWGGFYRVMNDDYFLLDVPDSSIFERPTVAVFDADEALDVTLYDGERRVLQSWTGVRKMSTVPPDNSTCFLKVSGKTPTRYRISTNMRVNSGVIPGPLEEELEIIPKWWGDPPPLRLKDIVTHYAVGINEARGDGNVIVFEQPNANIRLELLNQEGEVIREAEAAHEKLIMNTDDLEQGTYVLRAVKADEDRETSVELRQLPPLR